LNHTLAPGMSREELLGEVVAAERETHDLLECAARLATDPDERALFERLARREADALRELAEQEDQFDAEAFVQRAIGC
jgi:rubrerythrin